MALLPIYTTVTGIVPPSFSLTSLTRRLGWAYQAELPSKTLKAKPNAQSRRFCWVSLKPSQAMAPERHPSTQPTRLN